MKTPPRIHAFAPRRIRDLKEQRYDAFLASLGYEERSSQIPEVLTPPTIRTAVPFGDRHECHWEANKQWYDKTDWDQPELSEDDFSPWVDSWIRDLAGGSARRLGVDVSSMSRRRIAAVVETLLTLDSEDRLAVDFLYTPAEFGPPASGADPPVFEVAPVSSYFAGWWSDLELPLVAIIGVGYELELASSAIDTLEPGGAEVFMPDGEDERFREEVLKANKGLMSTKIVREPASTYLVSDPFTCFRQIEASLKEVESTNRVSLVPLGPKIFAVCSMLVAGMYPDSAQVIRVSAGERQEAIDRRSNGKVCGLTVVVAPPADQEEA